MIKKLFMGIVVVIVLGFVALFQFGGKAAESMIIELLAKQDTLQGSLEVANINADWSGKVILNDIIWRSDEKNNVIIAKIPSATVSVNLLEAILSGGNASSINDIVLDNPILYTGYQVDKGIEIVNNINFHEDSQKQDIKKTDFRGLIEVKDAVLEVMVGKEKLAFTNVQAQGNFKKYPTLKYNMHAKENNGDIILDITKENETLNILGDIKNIKVQNLLAFIPTLDGVVFKDGILQDCKITALKNSNDFTYSLDTVFSELQGEISQYQ